MAAATTSFRHPVSIFCVCVVDEDDDVFCYGDFVCVKIRDGNFLYPHELAITLHGYGFHGFY